jgi:hypothetical protein
MMRAVGIVIVAALLLAVAVAVLAPASLVAPSLERATRGRVVADDVDGTLWHGRAVLAAGPARLPVAWKLDPAPLLTGEAHIRLSPVDGMAPGPRADILAAERRLVFADVAVVVPAGILQQALTRNAPGRGGWFADGEIAATTSRLEWTPAAYTGDLRVAWRNARITVVPVLVADFGEATVALAAEGDRLAGPVTNSGGNLDLRGDVAIDTSGSATISLLLTPRRTDDEALARALAALGTPDGNGWRVRWRTAPP